MCFQPVYSFIYLFLGGICCRAKACHQQPCCSSAQAHTHKHTQRHTLLVSFSSLSLCLAFKKIPTFHPPHPPHRSPLPCPPSMLCLHLHFLASLTSRPFEVWNSSKSNPPPSLSLWTEGEGWVGLGGEFGGEIRNSETEAELRSALVITNRPSVAWCQKEFWIWIRPKQLDVRFIHTTQTTVKIGERTELRRENDLELPGAFKGSLLEGI